MPEPRNGVRGDVVPPHNHNVHDLPVGRGAGRIALAPVYFFQAVPTTPLPTLAGAAAFQLLPEMTTAGAPVPFVLPKPPDFIVNGWRARVSFSGHFSLDAPDPVLSAAAIVCVVDGVPDMETFRGFGTTNDPMAASLAFEKTYQLGEGGHTIAVHWANPIAGSTLKNGLAIVAPLARSLVVEVTAV